MDHLGLLEIIARRSGAEVAALDVLGPYLEDFSATATADDEFSMAVMRRHGVPAELATALRMVGAAFRAFGSSGQVTVPLREGTELTLRDRTLTALHRPGHSPSDTVFWDEQRQILIAGDHLLSRISSNPLISRPLDERAAGSGRRRGRPPARPGALHGLAARDPRDARAARPGRSRPAGDRARRAHRRALPHDRRGGRARSAACWPTGRRPPMTSPARCGATSRSRRPS